jgi:succinoglycan biosynthesis protein ExoO
VSVLIAAYNAEPFITRAIESVRLQTFPDWEMVVVDDASTDRTGSVVEDLVREDPRIRLLRQERNGGPGIARNSALDAATGEWIAILDADDAWRPERLERMLSVAQQTGAEFIADNHIVFDDAHQSEVGRTEAFPDIMPVTLELLFASEREDSRFRLGLMKPLIKRQALVERNMRYQALRYVEDVYLYAELLVTGVKAVMIPEAYYVYTSTVGPLSRQRSRSTHTVTAPDIRIHIADDLLSKYGSRLTVAERSEILRYRTRGRKLKMSRHITALREDGRVFELALFAVRHPGAAGAYLVGSRMFRNLLTRSQPREIKLH